MLRFRHWRSIALLRRLEGLVLGCLLVWLFCSDLLEVPFHPDESQWIASSSVFEAFVRGDRSAPVWEESHWTLTQPPGARYIIALGWKNGGYTAARLNPPWSFGRDEAANIAAGAMPTPELLWWSRLPMALLGAASCLLTFRLLAETVTRTAAYLGLMLVALNPMMVSALRRAMAESPLLFALLVVTYLGTRMLRRTCPSAAPAAMGGGTGLSRMFWLLILMGVFTGLAGSMKLNGLTALAGALVTWLLACAAPTLRPSSEPPVAIWAAGCALLIGCVVLTFVALNPFLDPDPLRRTLKLIRYRAAEIETQQRVDPAWVIDSPGERARVTYTYLFRSTALIHFVGSGVLQARFWLAGIAAIVRRSQQRLRREGSIDGSLVLLIMGATCAGPMLLTPLNWDRYFLLPSWFSALLVAVGMAGLLDRGRRAMVCRCGSEHHASTATN